MVHARCMPGVRVAYVYWAGDARWLARALRWGGAIDRVGHLGPGRAALARAHPDDARHDVATQQGQSAWARSGPWPPSAPDAHSLAQGHPLGPNPASATADSTPFRVWPSQDRGGGGHACGGHAATILRLLRGGGIHARPGRRMKRRASALALHVALCETWDVWSSAARGSTQRHLVESLYLLVVSRLLLFTHTHTHII